MLGIAKLRNLIGTCFFCFITMTASASFADNWIKVESNNFIFYSNVSEKHTIEYVKKLERFNFTLGALYSHLKEDGSKEKFKIYFVKSHNDLRKIEPKLDSSIVGFVRSCPDGLTGFSLFDGDKVTEANNLTKAHENISLAIMFHEYSHIFMFNKMGAGFPPWFVEGFAEYYGSMRINENGVLIGAPLLGRYLVIENDKLLNWADVIGENNKVTGKQDNGSKFYSQAWLLTHYVNSSPELKDKFGKFLSLRKNGEDKLKAFETAFGLEIKNLDKTLENYLKKDSKIQNFVFNKNLDLQIKTTPIEKNIGKFILLDAAISTCPTKENGQQFLEAIRKQSLDYSNDDFVQNTLAKAEIIIGDESKALNYYKSRIDKNENDEEAMFRYGQTIYLMTLHDEKMSIIEKTKQYEKARSIFFKTYKINPGNAQNLYYLSLTAKNQEKPDDASINAALEAFNLQPSIPEYAFNAAIMAIQNEEYEVAKFALQNLVSIPHNEKMANYLYKIIDAIDQKAPKEQILKLFNR